MNEWSLCLQQKPTCQVNQMLLCLARGKGGEGRKRKEEEEVEGEERGTGRSPEEWGSVLRERRGRWKTEKRGGWWEAVSFLRWGFRDAEGDTNICWSSLSLKISFFLFLCLSAQASGKNPHLQKLWLCLYLFQTWWGLNFVKKFECHL